MLSTRKLLSAGAVAVVAMAVPVTASADETGTVRGHNFFDRNLDGVFQPGEPSGYSGVGLYQLDGTSVVTVGTEDDASFEMTGIAPGRYRLGINPIGYQMTTPSEVIVDVTAGGVTGADFGKRGGDITGVTWHDLNADGQRQPDEPLLPNIQFWLGRAGFSTDASGHFALLDEGTSTYTFRFVAPQGMTFSPKNVGDPATDSDADPATGTATAVITLTDGKINQVPNLDIGLVGP